MLVDIIWDNNKNDWLILNRNISFQDIAEKILNNQYIDIVENPNFENQQYFIMELKKYIWVVPFLIDDNDNIVLKTAFPSRKFYKKYGRYIDEKEYE